jgi:hypothetical protein
MDIEKKRYSMRGKKLVLLLLFIVGIFSMSILFMSAQSTENTVCCERTISGAWCQNTGESQCDSGINDETGQQFRKSATSCESTSFCKQGCCVDSDEGLCMENTPQIVCQESGGVWSDDSQCNIAQCNLGCCVLGDQASFVTLTRCKKLSAQFGLETDFRRDVLNENSCIAIAQSQDKGACVTDEVEGGRSCVFTTRGACNSAVGGEGSFKGFFLNKLCSADELATDCGPTTETTCLEGKEEVYFKDSCGNPANIYDARRIYNLDPSYWQEIVSKESSCGADSDGGNAESRECGNCQYFKGSICGRGDATIGNLACRDLHCYDTENGRDYKNGESWCVYQANVGGGADPVGSRHFRHVCIDGEETIEPCADFRNDYCIEEAISSSAGDFIEAACRPNRYDSCAQQENKEDCENTDKRDCYYMAGAKISGVSASVFFTSITGGVCVPNVPPGLEFWKEGESQSMCNIGTTECVVKYEKRIIGGRKCVENCECLQNSWALTLNNVCSSLSDCGASVNVAGRFSEGGFEWKVNGAKRVVQGLLGQAVAKGGV